MKTVYLMLSGGVDSSVAALVLKDQGYDVRTVFMQCWSEEQLEKLSLNPSDYECAWDEDARDAEWVAHKLGLEFEIWDLREEYFQHVVQYMVEGYKQGKTPNPDVMCNSYIKFGVFSKRALAQGADFVATGHYARNVWSEKYQKYLLARALDTNKDQSYFLARVPAKLIEKSLFPIGEFATKSLVRAKAEEAGLITATKPDSQGICFIGDTPLREILLKTLGSNPGKIMELPHLLGSDPRALGEHEGAFQYTIGQRHALGLSGGPWFVHSIDIETNIVYVVHQKNAEVIKASQLKASELVLHVDTSQLPQRVQAQIRYRQPPQVAKISLISSSSFSLEFDSPIRAVAPGQTAALYDGEVLLGSGVIV